MEPLPPTSHGSPTLIVLGLPAAKLAQHRRDELRDRRMNRHRPREHIIGNVGIHDVDHAVMKAMVMPAAVSRPANDGPAWPAPMMIASNWFIVVRLP